MNFKLKNYSTPDIYSQTINYNITAIDSIGNYNSIQNYVYYLSKAMNTDPNIILTYIKRSILTEHENKLFYKMKFSFLPYPFFYFFRLIFTIINSLFKYDKKYNLNYHFYNVSNLNKMLIRNILNYLIFYFKTKKNLNAINIELNLNIKILNDIISLNFFTARYIKNKFNQEMIMVFLF